MLAWLMRNVSQPNALHDLFWWYASSLEPKADNVELKNVRQLHCFSYQLLQYLD
jgi:hypothetical protein